MDKELSGWKSSTVQMTAVAMNLRIFASEIIGHVLRGNILDETAALAIKAKCLREIKNLDVVGMGIDQESELLGKTIQLFEQMVDETIAEGWKRKKG